MAIYSSVPPPHQSFPPTTATTPPNQTIQPIDIPTWTATIPVQAPNITPSTSTLNKGVTLSIPIEEDVEERPKKIKGEGVAKARRDSMKRRDALLKGKEGSRRRQRWENDNLLNNPHVQPPLPSDWAPSATHRVTHVPYYLAPLWDAGVARLAAERASLSSRSATYNARSGIIEEKGRVPADLKSKLKKAKGAKTLLQELESEVRAFVREFDRAERVREARLKSNSVQSKIGRSRSSTQESAGSEVLVEADSEDEEIVFIGRDADGNGITMSDEVKQVMEIELQREKIVYEGLEGSKEGGFARWLVHSLAAYYGLASWSETRAADGKGMKRVAFVGVREKGGFGEELPRPLWAGAAASEV
ncbi:uncharacterized protein RCO7_01568 [Rhynchosporium graminicola]|uniref:R3H-associated N-terminal domain-containing protein n=1 Tax=Rhynchosporium graminicola TaxID=2792576 RepID=A0A1E1JZM2_9HELO|nr:uncharacterized protein RCO7_01568 [Rhynchosporium commune]